MRLEGIHHVTAITADAPRNVDFYARLLGLRLVKKTVNQDDPTVYHLFYADEQGSPGSDITFFEYRGARRGRAGAGMVHRVVWRVAGEAALDFWEERLRADSVEVERAPGSLRFSDFEGLDLELVVAERDDEPLVADHPEIPAELALQGFDGVRAFSLDPEASRAFLEETLGFEARNGTKFEARGEKRGSFYAYDEARERGIVAAGTVHHVAWASPMDEHEAWRERVLAGGASPTPVIDRFYFRSIYFREPSGVLFEIATIGPGFTADEPLESLGERLSLPPNYEHLRDRLEQGLITPRGPLSLPPGGRHWYAVQEIGYPDPATFLPTYAAVSEWLGSVAEETGVGPEQTVLGGFSQGAVMTYALGLGRGRPRPAALVALSGFIPTVPGVELDLEPPLPPVGIGHGTFDPVISVDWGRRACEQLEASGADVLYREYPLPHAVEPGFLAELAPWIASAL